MNKNQTILAVVALLLIGGGYFAVSSGAVDLSRYTSSENTNSEFLAMVNGEGIEKILLENRLNQIKNTYQSQGISLEELGGEDQLKQGLLDEIIDQTLLIQYAKNQGITVSDERIQEEYRNILAQFPSEEDFQTELNNQGFTQQTFQELLTQQIILQHIIDREIAQNPFIVTEQEIQERYDQSIIGQENVPEFEEVKDQIEKQLNDERIGQAIDLLLLQLREKGTIEILGS
jgi:hypothetical protein